MASQQKRISSAMVDAPDDGVDDVDEPGQDNIQAQKAFEEPPTKTSESKVIKVPQPKPHQNLLLTDEQYESDSGSTNSDIRDVLNCIRDPRDIKHVCLISCPALKKEEGKMYKASASMIDDAFVAPPYVFSQDYDVVAPKPVRIPIVHVKGCVHAESSVDFYQEAQEPCKWCFCEDEGTSEEEPDNNDNVYEKATDPNDAGFLKWSPLKQSPVDELGLVDWKNIPQDSDLQDILNCIFPPKVFNVNGKIMTQQVSAEVARRNEVIKLLEVLEMKIEEQQIKTAGIDSIRRKLFEQLFDELIRQECIVSPETGLLLVRMRDEMKMTIAAWESMLDHANNYATQQISKCGVRMKPLEKVMEKMARELEVAEQELTMFWAEQYLIKAEEQKRREYLLADRKAELAPHQSRNKLLKEQIRLLFDREEDNTTHQSHLS